MNFLIWGFCSIVLAIPVPKDHVALNSTEGMRLFKESNIDLGLFQNAQMQWHYATCSLASMAAVLNALEVPAPLSSVYPLKWAQYGTYPHFDEHNIYNNSCVYNTNPKVYQIGSTLEELAAMISCFTPAIYIHANETNLEGFRAKTKECLTGGKKKLLINYKRQTIEQKGGGHISPVIAYHEAEDMILVADTSNYKYPMWWIKVSLMWDALLTQDSDALPGNNFRGMVITEHSGFVGPDIMKPRVCEDASTEHETPAILVVGSVLCLIFMVSTIVLSILLFVPMGPTDGKVSDDTKVNDDDKAGMESSPKKRDPSTTQS